MINSCENILENKIIFFAKNHCEIQVRAILVCTSYSIKYGILKSKNIFWTLLKGWKNKRLKNCIFNVFFSACLFRGLLYKFIFVLHKKMYCFIVDLVKKELVNLLKFIYRIEEFVLDTNVGKQPSQIATDV
jgi:hypothetical protein